MSDVHSQLYLDRLAVGPIGTNCYIITNAKDKEIMVIDPGGDVDKIKEVIDAIGEKFDSKVTVIANTHCHPDHVFGNVELREYTGAKLYCHKADEFMLLRGGNDPYLGKYKSHQADGYLEDGKEIMLGTLPIMVHHTPGHTPGGCCLQIGHVVFCGDTLFRFSIGRTDFEGGSYSQLLESIRTKLFVLPDETVCFPGHGEETTIGEEKAGNPFLR